MKPHRPKLLPPTGVIRTVTALMVCLAARGATFDSAVRPILAGTCAECHDFSSLLKPGSIATEREHWEKVLAKLRAGEMPPKGTASPPEARIRELIQYVQGEFDKTDAGVKPDPGRVVAHRLNRSEYANTIRDLLGVNFQASQEFPTDDSSFGFDNIGESLTVSPTLLQKYLRAAEQIAARATGDEPLPKPTLYNKRDRLRRIGPGAMQMKVRVDYDADYMVRVNLVGHRGDQDDPVTLAISIDGKVARKASVPVQISLVNRQGNAAQRNTVEVRVFLSAGEHIFGAELVDDTALESIPADQRLSADHNIYPDSIEFAGPYPSSSGHAAESKLLRCDPALRACVHDTLRRLARRAYRRPVTKADMAELMRVYDKATASGAMPLQSVEFALTAMLVSPHFLFRIEHDPKPGVTTRISDVELASRLSYFLWSSIPDEELLRLAETDRLHDPAVLEAQVKRMIADQKSAAFAQNFAGQWLEIRSLDAVKPDAKKFPQWNGDLRDAMRSETTMFFDAVLKEDRPISDFIDGNYTFLNDTLAQYYGIDGVTGPEFRRVELTPQISRGERSGVLTQASVLTVSSYPVRTSVVLRGKWVLENILGAPPPPPPPDVPQLDNEQTGVSASLRQQMEQHRANAVCASCHTRMDALGFGLENYDAIGRWRVKDGQFPVDATGTFPNGKSFSTPAEMKTLLLDDMPDFARCLTEKLLTYSLGRGIQDFDRRTVRDIVRQSAAQDYRLQSMIMAIVQSPAFLETRGELPQRAAK